MTSSPRRITLWLATPVFVFNLSACNTTTEVATPASTTPESVSAKLDVKSTSDADLLASVPNLGDQMYGHY